MEPINSVDDFLLTLYGDDAPRCRICKRPYSRMEANAGYTTCDHHTGSDDDDDEEGVTP